jgi:hypothetical protein
MPGSSPPIGDRSQQRPLESVNQSFADIPAGRIPARIVADSWSATTTQ